MAASVAPARVMSSAVKGLISNCFNKAVSVAGGTVLTVLSATKVSTYKTSEYAGFLVLVDAQSGRCLLPPLAVISEILPEQNAQVLS